MADEITQVDNETVARSMASLEDYDLMIRNYQHRVLSEGDHLWFRTVVRQRELKRKEQHVRRLRKAK